MYSTLFLCYHDSDERLFRGKEVQMMDASVGTLLMIICYVFGTGLVILEAFMPGFGIAGIAGVILEIVGIVLTNTYFGLTWSLIATLAALIFVGFAIFFSYRSAMKGRLSKSALILKDTEQSVPVPPDMKSWLDQKGVTVTALRPAGFVEIGGRRLNASTTGEFLSKGTSVKVTGAEGDHLIVTKA